MTDSANVHFVPLIMGFHLFITDLCRVSYRDLGAVLSSILRLIKDTGA